MTLQDVCEPLFQYLCRLNRGARKGGSFDFTAVRREINDIFSSMKSHAAENHELGKQYEKVEMPLAFFVDSVIAENSWSISKAWNKERLAYDYNELAGDEKFFDLLDETMQDTSEAATERLIIYYTCIGLGFQGWYTGKPEYLRKKMKEMSSRIRNFIKTESSIKICPKAYENIDSRNLIQPPSQQLMYLVIAAVTTMLLLFIMNIMLFRSALSDLPRTLKAIIAEDPVTSDKSFKNY